MLLIPINTKEARGNMAALLNDIAIQQVRSEMRNQDCTPPCQPRHVIPWLARWSTVDALEVKYVWMSPYNHGFNNLVKHIKYDGKGVIYSNSGAIFANRTSKGTLN